MSYAQGTYMLVYHGYIDSWDYGIFGLRMNDSLATLDSYPQPLVRTSWADDLYYYNPTIATDGSDFLRGLGAVAPGRQQPDLRRAHPARRYVARRRRRPDLGRAPCGSVPAAERGLGRHAVGRRLAPGRPDAARARGRRGQRARCGRPGDRAARRPVLRRRRERSAARLERGAPRRRAALRRGGREGVDRPGHRTRGRPVARRAGPGAGGRRVRRPRRDGRVREPDGRRHAHPRPGPGRRRLSGAARARRAGDRYGGTPAGRLGRPALPGGLGRRHRRCAACASTPPGLCSTRSPWT